MASITRSRVARGAVLAGAGALALSLVTAVAPASATAPTVADLSFAYLPLSGEQVLSTNNASASGTPVAATATGYQVYGYDASWDGQTWAACMATGPADKNYSAYDRTYALTLTTGATSTVLSTFCESAPVVTGDGSAVYWLAGNKVYKRDVAGATTTVVSSGQFVTGTGEEIIDVAVSPQGTSGAVLFRNKASSYYRLRVAQLSRTNATDWSELKTSSAVASTVVPQPYAFLFADESTLYFDKADTTATASKTLSAFTTTVPAAGTGAAATWADTAIPALDGIYDLHDYSFDAGATVGYAGWKDEFASGTYVKSTAYDVANLTSAPELLNGTDRADGATTKLYVPVTGNLPQLQQAANRPAATIEYFLHANATKESPASIGLASRTPIIRGAAMAYHTANYYLVPATGTAPTALADLAKVAAETDRGDLESCIKATCTDADFAKVRTTSGASYYGIAGKWYFGSTVVQRNTLLRWNYKGDLFTAPGTSAAKAVYAAPIITIKKSVSGTSTRIYGTAYRTYGVAASLQRLTSLGWRTVASIAHTTKGNTSGTYAAFNFGYRKLPHGSYRVSVGGSTAMGDWVAAGKRFSL